MRILFKFLLCMVALSPWVAGCNQPIDQDSAEEQALREAQEMQDEGLDPDVEEDEAE